MFSTRFTAPGAGRFGWVVLSRWETAPPGEHDRSSGCAVRRCGPVEAACACRTLQAQAAQEGESIWHAACARRRSAEVQRPDRDSNAGPTA